MKSIVLVEKVIINASPLIVLFKSKQSELLPQLFTEILVPEAVWKEITAKNDEAARQLTEVSWAKSIAGIIIHNEIANWDLGKGESEVLSFSFNQRDYVAVVDDRAAKKCAQSFDIITLGTGGILLLAKRRGLISDVSSRLQDLQNAGLWLSDSIINLLKQQANE